MSILVDVLGRPIAIGDVVLYTAAGAGRNLPPMEMGEVVNLTKAGVTVKNMDPITRAYRQRKEYIERPSGRFYQERDPQTNQWVDSKTQIPEFVPTGQMIDVEPENIRWYKDRFYIV